MWLVEHLDLVVAVLALLGAMTGAVLAGGIHVGKITKSIDHLSDTLRSGFRRNTEEHDLLHRRIDIHTKEISRLEGKIDRRNNGNAAP